MLTVFGGLGSVGGVFAFWGKVFKRSGLLSGMSGFICSAVFCGPGGCRKANEMVMAPGFGPATGICLSQAHSVPSRVACAPSASIAEISKRFTVMALPQPEERFAGYPPS